MRHDAAISYAHENPGYRVIQGENAVDCMAEELAALGAQRVLVVCGQSAVASGLIRRFETALGNRQAEIFSGVRPRVPISSVEEGARLAEALRADVLVAVGGGSTMDTAKGIALLLAEGLPIARHAMSAGKDGAPVVGELRHAKLPIVAVPLTASGAEVTPVVGLSMPDGSKLRFRDYGLISRVIVLDPNLNLAVPPSVVGATGMNGLAHCIEGAYSTVRDPISTALAIEGARLLSEGLDGMAREPLSVAARGQILAGAHLAGRAIINARTGLHHAICHCVGTVSGVGHGIANAVIVPHALRFNLPCAERELLPLARALLRKARVTGEQLAWFLTELARRLDLPCRLRDVGVNQQHIRTIAARVMDEPGLRFNPRPITNPEEVKSILRAAW